MKTRLLIFLYVGVPILLELSIYFGIIAIVIKGFISLIERDN